MVVIGSRFIYVKRQKKKEKSDKIDKSTVDNDSEKKTDASVGKLKHLLAVGTKETHCTRS